VKLVNPCLNEHGYQFPYSLECQGKGILKTDYGAVIAENVTADTLDNSTGRINGILFSDRFVDIPWVSKSNYSDADAVKFAGRIYDTINTVNQYQCLNKQSNCLSLEVKDVKFQTNNLIRGIHYAFPFIHVEENSDGWCFIRP
jgi:hypothetical protein